MSDIPPKSGGGGAVKDRAEICRLLRERFAPLARFGGSFSLCRNLHEPGNLWKPIRWRAKPMALAAYR